MSSKKARTTKKKEDEPAEVKATVRRAKPPGRAPQAVVSSRHGSEMVARPAKGFSLGELSRAGFPAARATPWGVRLDSRRRSVLEPNTQALKDWFAPPRKTPEPPTKAEKTPKPEKPAKKRAPRKKRKEEAPKEA